jgi:sugar lactone lactonase YvrE
LSQLKDVFAGGRDARLSIPIMDGALKPNNLLEDAEVFFEQRGLEDLALGPDGALFAAAGESVLRLAPDGTPTEIARFDREVTALAILGGGALAVGLGNAVAIRAASSACSMIDSCDGRPLRAVNALHATADGTLLISDGSATNAYAEWSRDLLEKGRTGRLLAHDWESRRMKCLATGLSYAFGVLRDTDGRIIVSESWRHRLCLAVAKPESAVLANLPGYPARMSPAHGGGFWLSVFACRTQLVEFVLCEDRYRREMMRSVDPRYWVAPALTSGHDFLEPLQGGGVKQMGILKPWAPPRSYGLVVRIGADFQPRYALHSRVGGRNQGVVAAAERDDDLFVLAKGAGRILRLSVSRISAGAAA